MTSMSRHDVIPWWPDLCTFRPSVIYGRSRCYVGIYSEEIRRLDVETHHALTICCYVGWHFVAQQAMNCGDFGTRFAPEQTTTYNNVGKHYFVDPTTKYWVVVDTCFADARRTTATFPDRRCSHHHCYAADKYCGTQHFRCCFDGTRSSSPWHNWWRSSNSRGKCLRCVYCPYPPTVWLTSSLMTLVWTLPMILRCSAETCGSSWFCGTPGQRWRSRGRWSRPGSTRKRRLFSCSMVAGGKNKNKNKNIWMKAHLCL